MEDREWIPSETGPTGVRFIGKGGSGSYDPNRPERWPTVQQTQALLDGFNFFNQHFFEGSLPQVLITLQRRSGAYGYFSSDRFAHRDGRETTSEIALNPSYFWEQPEIETLSTLLHEMIHHEQDVLGTSGRGRYHNLDFARRMEKAGLIASDTGKPGGRKTGDRMTHYIAPGGPFEAAYAELKQFGFSLVWGDKIEVRSYKPGVGGSPEGEPPMKKVSKQKFECGSCSQRAWAKPSARLDCGDCKRVMLIA